VRSQALARLIDVITAERETARRAR